MSSERGVDAAGPAFSSPPPARSEGEYVQVLEHHLPPELLGLVPFFSRPQRLSVLASLLDRHFVPGAGRPAVRRGVLDLGCGPLASEYFLTQLQGHAVLAVDYTPAFGAVHAALQQRGHLDGVEFLVGDANGLDFGDRRFDLILMHDLLYEPALSFARLLPRYDRLLRHGGLLYLTVQDERTRWIWKLLGREKAHVRYDVGQVRARLREAGYDVLDTLPASLNTHQGANRVFQHLLWRSFGLANQVAIMARKRASSHQ